MSPNDVNNTSGRAAIANARSIISNGVTHTGQPGPWINSINVSKGIGTAVNGPNAMTGQIDLSLETQNLNVKVTPQLGDTASTVVGLVNPIAGLATLIAGRLVKNPLGKMFAYDYSINGTWSDPKVEKVQPEAAAQAVEPGSPLR